MEDLNRAMTAALRGIMTDRGVTQRAVADYLHRSADYVSGRMTGRHALSVDIITAAAALMGLSDRALMADVMTEVARMGQGESPR